MKVKATAKCFYRGHLYKEGEVTSLSDERANDESVKRYFEVIESPKRKAKRDSTGDSQPSSA